MSEENVILGNGPALDENKTPVEIGGAIVAVSQKASTAYVKQVAANLKSELEAQIDGIDTANGALGGRVTALEGAVNTINGDGAGSIAAAVAAEAAIARAAEKANADDIAVIKGDASTTGSIAKAVAEEAAIRKNADDALDGRLDTVEGQISTINGDGTGSIAKALDDAKDYADGKAATLQTAIDGKVAKNGTDRLMTDAEGVKLAALPTNAQLTSALEAKANAADVTSSLALKADAANVYTKTEVDSAISTAAATVFRYKGSKDAYASLPSEGNVTGDVWHVANAGTNGSGAEYVWNGTGWEELGTAVNLSAYSNTEAMNTAIGAAKEAAIAAAGTAADEKVADAKDIIDAYTVNGKAISTAPVLGAADILMTGYTPVSVDDTVDIATTDDINDAFRAVISHLNTLDEVSGGAVGDLSALSGRVTAVEGAVTTLNGNNTTAGSVAKQVKDAVDAEASARATADEELDGRLDVAEAEIDAIEALLPKDYFNNTNTVKDVLDTKADAVAGHSLVADLEIDKLAAYPEYSVVEDIIDAKVTAEAGKGLVPTADITKLAALPTNIQLSNMLAAKADKQPVIMSIADPILEAGKRYVVTDEFDVTLPAEPVNGTIVEIFVLVGGANRIVRPNTGDTILGYNKPCAIGISEEGWQLDNESYTFVYEGGNDNWHVL